MTHFKSTLAASLVVASLAVSTVAPAKADQAAVTRNILLGAAAVAGIVIETNVARKNAQATASPVTRPTAKRSIRTVA